MKTRVIRENGRYYPQKHTVAYGWIGFQNAVTNIDPMEENCGPTLVSFHSLPEAKEFLEPYSTTVVWESDE
jgi:hypothetical protein